jgi:hypothetical protein
LKRGPAHLFALGGGGAAGLVHTGFARGDVVDLAPAERAGDVTVVLSKAWRPAPWEGEPIRFFFVFAGESSRIDPRALPHVSLTARLRDGRVVHPRR